RQLWSALGQQDSQRPNTYARTLCQIISAIQQVDRGGLFRLILDRINGGERRGHRFVELLEIAFQLVLLLFRSAAKLRLDPPYLRLNRVDLRLPCRLLFLAGLYDVVGVGLGEVRLQAVVVRLTDGVEFVVVAARASYSQAEIGRPDDVRHLGEHFIAR